MEANDENEIEKLSNNLENILCEIDFYTYVDEILSELGVDCNSFYR